jgi:hypothetical protein
MGALCADCENLVAAARQDHVFAIGLPKGRRSIREIVNGKSFSKIGVLRFFCFCHFLCPRFHCELA